MYQKLNGSFSNKKNTTENMNKSAVALQWSKVCSEFMCTYYDAGVSSFRVLLSRREGGSGGRVGGRQMELFSEKERPFSPWASPVTHTHTHTPVTTILMDWCMIIVNMSSAYCRSLLLVLCWLLILHASLCYYIITFDIISKRFMKHSLFYVFFPPLDASSNDWKKLNQGSSFVQRKTNHKK